jgi:hypothetical protein
MTYTHLNHQCYQLLQSFILVFGFIIYRIKNKKSLQMIWLSQQKCMLSSLQTCKNVRDTALWKV